MFLILIASITKSSSSPRVTGESTTVTTRIHFMWSSLSSSPFSNCWFKVSSSMLFLDRVTKTTLQKVKISLGYFKHGVPNGLLYQKNVNIVTVIIPEIFTFSSSQSNRHLLDAVPLDQRAGFLCRPSCIFLLLGLHEFCQVRENVKQRWNGEFL